MGQITKRIETIFVLPFDLAPPVDSLVNSIEANEDEFKDANRSQLLTGNDSNGNSLGRYARFEYKQRFEPVDLKLTGDFQEAFEIQVDKKQTEIFSQDWKEGILKKRYGKDIFGVAKKYLDNIRRAILPEFQNDYKRRLLK